MIEFYCTQYETMFLCNNNNNRLPTLLSQTKHIRIETAHVLTQQDDQIAQLATLRVTIHGCFKIL